MNTQEQHLLLNQFKLKNLTGESITLLKQLIAISSFSKEEEKTAGLIQKHLESKGINTFRQLNNVWCFNKNFDNAKPTILLNSHHDTVKPNNGFKLNPFEALVHDGKLYGLGSNDAGGALVSLLAAFLYFNKKKNLNYNLIYAATAEEEISGKGGVELILSEFGKIDFAIVGEPTEMQLAISEKGLMVLDCIVKGKPGHAAREEGDNAIYKAIKAIDWFQTFQFPKISETLGSVKMSVTMIQSGTQHNVVPDICCFTVDIRTTDVYSNIEVLEIINDNVDCEIKPRSLHLNSSSIGKYHPIVKAGISLGRITYGSPTSSDQALMNFPSLKIGPGNSARSHTADEYIYLNELEEGIELYIKMLNEVL